MNNVVYSEQEILNQIKKELESFIQNKELYISKNNWTDLNYRYKRPDIQITLAEIISEGKINLPITEYTENDAKIDFNNLLNTASNRLVDVTFDNFFSRREYKYPFSDIVISSGNLGNISSNYFQQINRFDAGHVSHPSPTNVWKNKQFAKTVLGALWTLKMTEISQDSLKQAIALKGYIASQFKPNIAKFIYDSFKVSDVYDFSSGWGDRLAGFYASNAKSYLGTDPNIKVYQDYYRQIELYEKFVHKVVHIENLPAEDLNLNDRTFDCVFTSPPYFSTERYSNDENQSWKRYKKIDLWLNNFLFKVIRNAWEHLRDSGFMIINISDVYVHHKIQFICDPMNDFISGLKNANYLGCIGMKMAKRPLSDSSKEGIFAEPMWVFQKSENPIKLESLFKTNEIDLW